MQKQAYTVSFHVFMDHPETHTFRVRMEFSGLPDSMLTLQMAVWTPGSYLIREYAKNVDYLKVIGKDGKHPFVVKVSKNAWEIHGGENIRAVEYAVYAFEESVRTCFLDTAHASIIPAGLFICPAGYTGSYTIHLHPFRSWKKVSTALPAAGIDPWIRIAENTDILIDSPLEIGNQIVTKFRSAGVDHELAVYGPGNYDLNRIRRDLRTITAEATRVFGEHPCKGALYLFILQNAAAARGGLEHKFSSSILFPRFEYASGPGYRQFLGLMSHEYFHLWNVKRLRPAALGPFQYDRENYTPSLWIAEGFTNYYDDLIVCRAGLMTREDFFQILCDKLDSTVNASGDGIQTLADASFDAWIKFYRQNENSPNVLVNYYIKGSVLAILLDLIILVQTGGRRSLDNVMRAMYRKYGKKEDRGYTEAEFLHALEKAAGKSLRAFYRDHVLGTKQLRCAPYFAGAGLLLETQREVDPTLFCGMRVDTDNHITFIRRGSPAEKAGLSVHDELLAIGKYRYDDKLPELISQQTRPGSELHVLYNRNGLTGTCVLHYRVSWKTRHTLRIADTLSALQQKILRRWLRN